MFRMPRTRSCANKNEDITPPREKYSTRSTKRAPSPSKKVDTIDNETDAKEANNDNDEVTGLSSGRSGRPTQPIRRLPNLRSLLKDDMTQKEILAIISARYPSKYNLNSQMRNEDVSEDQVRALVQATLENPDFRHELCDFSSHVPTIERLKIENQILEEQANSELSRNIALTGELSRYKTLAHRVLYGDKEDGTWNSRNGAFIQLIGQLLRHKANEED